MEQLATNLTNSLQEAGISPLMVVFVISLLPILELRGGLIAAAILGVDYVPALLVSILGNALPVPCLLYTSTCGHIADRHHDGNGKGGRINPHSHHVVYGVENAEKENLGCALCPKQLVDTQAGEQNG